MLVHERRQLTRMTCFLLLLGMGTASHSGFITAIRRLQGANLSRHESVSAATPPAHVNRRETNVTQTSASNTDSYHYAKPATSNITGFSASNKTSLDGRQFTNTITVAPVPVTTIETTSSNISTSPVLFHDGPPVTGDSSSISSVLSSILSLPPPPTSIHTPHSVSSVWPGGTRVWTDDRPQGAASLLVPSQHEHTYSFITGGIIIDGTSTSYIATISLDGMAAITTITQESSTITLFSQTPLPPFDPGTLTTSTPSHSNRGSSSLQTLTTEHLSTCIASNGDRCMCHDNVCLGTMPISTRTQTSTSTISSVSATSTSTASTVSHAPSGPPPTAAIATPIAFVGILALVLLLPCILPRLSPRVAAKFNRICPLDDLYRGIAATWAKLKLTRHRNRSIRKRGSSNMSYSTHTVSPSPRKSLPVSEPEKQTEVPESNIASGDSSYLSHWRMERERKLVDTRQRQLRDGVWGGSPEELERELARTRQVELMRVKEEKELGRWMAGDSGSAGPSTPTRGAT